MMQPPRPVTLTGKRVRLEPLRREHAEELFEVAQDPEIWQYMPVPAPQRVEDVARWIGDALDKQEQGQVLPFVIRECNSGRAMGSTRYLDISVPDRHVEIGWTWLARTVWRTPVNTECKYLLLRHAFDDLACIRVALKTDLRNVRSQKAIERLGAVREGVLRRVVITHSGYHRSSVYYSILDDEWPYVKTRLQQFLSQS